MDIHTCRWCGREYDYSTKQGSSYYYCSEKCRHEAEAAGS